VLVVVPTVAIADGWQRSASSATPSAPNMPLRSTRDWRPVDPIGDDWLGAIITYQSLFFQTEMFLAHATDPGQRTLVIFDEVHHAGTDGAWGTSAQEAFASRARAILSMSGTPFRVNKDPIVFVPSEGGNALPHYSYSYDQAIADGACRPVQFVEARGETTFRTEDGVVHTVSFDDDALTDLGERRALLADRLQRLEWHGFVVSIALDPHALGVGAVGEDHDRWWQEVDHVGNFPGHLQEPWISREVDPPVVVDVHRVGAHHSAHYLAEREQGQAVSEINHDPKPRDVNAFGNHVHGHDPRIVGATKEANGIGGIGIVLIAQARASHDGAQPDHVVSHMVCDGRRVIAVDADDQPRCVGIALFAQPHDVAVGIDEHLLGDRTWPDPLERRPEPAVFDTDGHEADATLIECARLFIEREGLTGTDPESLAIAAGDAPELKAALLALRDT
jgi:hypothetical protein